MLEEIKVEGWKSFERASVKLGRLTVLVGPNASGKSNLLDALRFIHGLALGLTIGRCLEGSADNGHPWAGVRGGTREMGFRGSRQIGLALDWALDDRRFRRTLRASLGADPSLDVEELIERTRSPEVTLIAARGLSTAEAATSGGDARQQRSIKIHDVDREIPIDGPASSLFYLFSFLVQVSAAPVIAVNRSTDAATRVRQAEAAMRFFEPSTIAMRGYASRKRDAVLGAGCENLSAVLWRLCRDPERRASLVDWVSELCAPKVLDLDFIEVEELDDVMLVLVEEGGTRVTARSLSDGTLRFLALLAAVLTAEPGSVLIFEEIESGLHPTRLHLLLELLERTTKARDLQVIATTHSPVALRELSKDALGDAVVFGRLPDVAGTVMRRLRDLPRFEELAASRGVEHLFTTGWLERAL